MNATQIIAAIAITISVGACTTDVPYNPDHVPETRISYVVNGKGLVYMEPAQESYVFKGPPADMPGSPSKITLPIGLITREIATKVFSQVFSNGVDFASSKDDWADYMAVVEVSTTDFRWRSTEHPGLASATIMMDVVVRTKLYGADGSLIFNEFYRSGPVTSPIGSNLFNLFGKMPDQFRTFHETLHRLFSYAAEDMKATLTEMQDEMR